MARGLTMNEVAVYAGVNYPIVKLIDRLEPGKIGRLSVEKLMRVSMVLECSPAELVPFLTTRVKGHGRRNKSPTMRLRTQKSVQGPRDDGNQG
jgi:transcriptional regulator with XRE-family HTH domain